MKLLCKIGLHTWKGCKCTLCGYTRNEQHDWNGCKCNICQQRRDEGHNWNKCTCSICGEIRNVNHAWGDDCCDICGEMLPAKEWAQKLKNKKDFRTLAAMYRTCTEETYDRFHAAQRVLNDVGPLAVDAIIEQLKLSPSYYLIGLLITIGDPRAVPLFKELLLKEKAYLSAYGAESKVKEFIAKFDPEIKKQLEESARKEKEEFIRTTAKAATAVASYTESKMVSVLTQLCKAFANDDPSYKDLEPLATEIGKKLDKNGGISEMRRVFNLIPDMRGKRTLEMHWGGIGDWRR